MTNLETTNFGNLRSATVVSTSEQISSHINSIVDANEVELGKDSVAKSYGIALGLSAVAGLN